MRISTQTPLTVSQAVTPQTAPATSTEPKDTVTFNKEKNGYDFNGPRGHEFKDLRNPFKEALQAAALVGVPALIGAGESAAFGVAGGTFATLPINIPVGILAGASIMGYNGYKEGEVTGAAVGTFFGAIGGAIGGAVLPLVGTWGGLTGAAVATGVVGAGVAIWALSSNHKVHQEAIAHGYKPE